MTVHARPETSHAESAVITTSLAPGAPHQVIKQDIHAKQEGKKSFPLTLYSGKERKKKTVLKERRREGSKEIEIK